METEGEMTFVMRLGSDCSEFRARPVIRGNLSRLRMLCSVGMAAGFLHRSEFHDLDAGAIRVIGIQTVFAVASDLRPIECFQSSCAKLGCGGVYVFHAEGKMILYAEFVVVCVR